MNTNEHKSEPPSPIFLKDEVYQLTGCAMSVLNALGHGFSEKVYENAFVVELGLQNIPFKQQQTYKVSYKNVQVGSYVPDLIVNDQIILELKTIDRITNVEIGQVLNYLKATGLGLALILNFKNPKLEWQRVVL